MKTTNATILQLAERWHVTPAEYHADRDRLSHSQLEDFISDPALYEGRWLTREYPHERSDAMDLGTIVHDVILCGGENCVVAEIPNNVLSSSGSRAGNAWKAWKAEQGTKYCLKRHEIALVRKMREAICAHPKARAILGFEGESEVAIKWHSTVGDALPINRRSLLDRVAGGGLFVLDLKTSHATSRREFEKHAYAMGYHRQAAEYLIALEMITGVANTGFIWVVSGKTPPYSVETYIPDHEFIALGRAECAEALEQFAICQSSGVWRRPKYGELITISAPKWAYQQ